MAGRKDIERVNPQRFEMVQLTGIVHTDTSQHLFAGYKDVTGDEFWVRGHMPDYPLMPGVLMCEAAAQLCSYYIMTNGLMQGDFLGFGGMENVRFRGPVRPGDRLVLIGKGTKMNRRQCIFNVQGFVGSTMVFHADIIGVPLVRREGTESTRRGGSLNVRRRPRVPLEELGPYLLTVGQAFQPDSGSARLESLNWAPLDWRTVFGNGNPVELEVGFGKGLFLMSAAQTHPEINFVGVEIVRKYQLFTATHWPSAACVMCAWLVPTCVSSCRLRWLRKRCKRSMCTFPIRGGRSGITSAASSRPSSWPSASACSAAAAG